MRSFWIVFAVVSLVAISCSAAEAPEQTNEPPGMWKAESVDRLGGVHSNQAVIQAPPSFEGADPWTCFESVRCYLTGGV